MDYDFSCESHMGYYEGTTIGYGRLHLKFGGTYTMTNMCWEIWINIMCFIKLICVPDLNGKVIMLGDFISTGISHMFNDDEILNMVISLTLSKIFHTNSIHFMFSWCIHKPPICLQIASYLMVLDHQQQFQWFTETSHYGFRISHAINIFP